VRRSSPNWRPAERRIESSQINLEKTQLISRTVPLHDLLAGIKLVRMAVKTTVAATAAVTRRRMLMLFAKIIFTSFFDRSEIGSWF
jgi:hypothetical protein